MSQQLDPAPWVARGDTGALERYATPTWPEDARYEWNPQLGYAQRAIDYPASTHKGMRSFSLWLEGYAATGEHGEAQHLGTYLARTFREAVTRWNREENSRRTWGELTWRGQRAYAWGCRIYDNERAARKHFG